MRLLIQWTLASPLDWQALDVRRDQDWRRQPALPDPTGSPRAADDTLGHVFALGCQAVTLSGDHYAVEVVGDGLRVHVINDDPDDWPGRRHAYVWTFDPLRPDPRFGGKLNTHQRLEVYADPAALSLWPRGLQTTAGPVPFWPWESYRLPPSPAIRHGLQVPDQLAAAHNAARSRMSLGEWSA